MTCFTCNKEKDLTEFHRDSSHKNGYKSTCKDCIKENRKLLIVYPDGSKLCKKCRIIKPKNSFPINKGKPVGKCKQCLLEYYLMLEKPKEKRCTKCKELKNIIEFGKDSATKSGVRGHCRTCEKIRRSFYNSRNKMYSEKYKGDPEFEYKKRIITRVSGMRSRGVKITKEEYVKLIENNIDNRCTICKNLYNKKTLFVDHCHSTGEVRGLLCHHCNMLLGNSKDSIITLNESIGYLQNFNEKLTKPLRDEICKLIPF